MKLDSSKEQPLYVQLYECIRNDIEKGKYPAGKQIPTEAQLSQIYNVSRITVRKALDELTQNRILTRHRGKGTFVSENKMLRSVSGVKSFTEICHAMGCTPRAKVIKCKLEPATKSDMEELELPENSLVLAIERIRYADDVPVSLEKSRLPESYSFLLNEDLNDTSMFDIIREKYHLKFMKTYKTLELAFASTEASRYLKISDGYPLILIEALSCDQYGKPAHRSQQFIVGDKFKLIL